jgi:hypothetical protein
MAKCRAEHKHELVKQGRWREFVQYRSSLEVGGMVAASANTEAVRRFLGEEAAGTAGENGGKHNRADGPVVFDDDFGPEPDDIDEPEEKGKKGTQSKDSKKRVANKDKAVISSVPDPPPPVKRSAFVGKPDTSEVENIRWVADNMRIVDIKPRDCPSLRAWNLLCECRENSYFRSNFWKDHYGKIIPSKSQLTDGDGKGKLDGEATVELIERIEKISEESKEEAGV